MSAFRIPSSWLMFAAYILTCLVTGCDRGPSTIGKHITQQINDTKRQIKPADIQAALSPFFSARAASNSFPNEITTPLPHQIRSLPIFSDSPQSIMVFLNGSNSLALMVGGGFGHWGMIVIRPGSKETYDSNKDTTSIPWDDGVYFFSQYR
jgi:hypothetical protein